MLSTLSSLSYLCLALALIAVLSLGIILLDAWWMERKGTYLLSAIFARRVLALLIYSLIAVSALGGWLLIAFQAPLIGGGTSAH